MSRLLAVALLVASCKDDPGPACDKVVDHMAEVTKSMMTGHDQVQIKTRALDIQFCEHKQFSKAARECLVGAKDVAGIAACQKLLPPAPKGSGS
jgi:hypothetical protein